MAHAWKACWCNSLTSSNLVSSAIRVFEEIREPFSFAENSFLSTIPNGLDCRNSVLVVSSEGVRPDDIGGTLRGASGRPNRCTTLCLKGATHDIR